MVNIKIMVLWDVLPCNLADRYTLSVVLMYINS